MCGFINLQVHKSSADVKERVELYFHSPQYALSWRGAQLKKHRDNFALIFYLYDELIFGIRYLVLQTTECLMHTFAPN